MRRYLDDDTASPLLAKLLGNAGHDVQLPSAAGMSGKDDAVHLTHAIQDDRTCLTKNHGDFETLHNLIVAANGFFPALWILFTSLKTERELIRVPISIIPSAPTLDNYVRVFTDQPIGTFLWNSFVVASLATLLCVTVSALAAYALVRLRLPVPGLILSVLMAVSICIN